MLKYCMMVFTGMVLSISFSYAADFSLSSQTVVPGTTLSAEQVFKGFGCEGENISPDLQWRDAPEDTKSFAITVYDPDAPTGSGWWHWLVYNIPSKVNELATGAGAENGQLPDGVVQGRNDYGVYGFGGACPPEGDEPHRYIFTVFALKTEKIELPEDASAALIGYMINANTLAKASFTAKYGR